MTALERMCQDILIHVGTLQLAKISLHKMFLEKQNHCTPTTCQMAESAT